LLVVLKACSEEVPVAVVVVVVEEEEQEQEQEEEEVAEWVIVAVGASPVDVDVDIEAMQKPPSAAMVRPESAMVPEKCGRPMLLLLLPARGKIVFVARRYSLRVVGL